MLPPGCQAQPSPQGAGDPSVKTEANTDPAKADTAAADKTAADRAGTAEKTPPHQDREERAKTAADGPSSIPDGPTTEPQYHVIARTKDSVKDDGEGYPRFRVFGTDDGEVLVAHGPWLMRPDADGTLENDPMWVRGIEPHERDPMAVTLAVDWTIHSLGGRWPDELYMATAYIPPFRAGNTYNQTYRWLGDRWLRLDTERPRYVSFPERVEAWGGSIIALRSFSPRYRKVYAEMGPPAPEERAIRAAIAKVKPLSVYAGPAKAPRLPETIADFDTLPSGKLMGITTAQPPRLLTYDPKTEETTTSPLPDADDSGINGIVLVADDRGYVFGSAPNHKFEQSDPYLARFDGETWHREKGPPCGEGLIGASWSKTAGLYAICLNDQDFGVYPSGDLWRLISGGWIEVELPLRGSVTGVVADGIGGVWIATTQAAYGPRRPRKILEVGGFDDIVTRMAEHGDPSPTRLRCEPMLEMHYTLLRGDVGGDHRQEKDLLTRALAGDDGLDSVEVVEVQFRDEPRLALQVSGTIEAPSIRRIEGAFGERLGDTYCFVREPL